MAHISIDGMGEFAAQFVRRLSVGPDSATVVTLSGDLGAGKTTFAQGVAAALGVAENVTSPTFVLEKIYALQTKKWQRLIHIDAYRLKGTHELEVLGWRELLEDPGNLIVLEWPERVAGAIPADAIQLRFEITEDGGRKITHDALPPDA